MVWVLLVLGTWVVVLEPPAVAQGNVATDNELYPAQVRTRKSVGEMMRKLSVT